jgi:hypothetical protein
VPFTVPEDRVGVAYGLTTAIQNAGLALFPLMAAAIYKVQSRTRGGSPVGHAPPFHPFHPLIHPSHSPARPHQAAGSEYIPHVELLFVYLAVVGLAFGLWLNVLDSR